MTTPPRVTLSDEDIDDTADVVGALEQEWERVRIISSLDGRWAYTDVGHSGFSAVGTYGAELLVGSIFGEADSGQAIIAAGQDDSGSEAYRVVHTTRGVTWDRIEPSEIPQPTAALTGPQRRLLDVLATLRLEGLEPQTSPLALSGAADAILNLDVPEVIESESVVGTSGHQELPLGPATGALHGTGVLAEADVADAVRALRSEISDCDEVFAERWGHLVHVGQLDRFLQMRPDPSPTAGLGAAYAPAAHFLGDWLELSVAELAAGRGNLVILGGAAPPEDDASGTHAATARDGRQWTLWTLFHGKIIRNRLRSQDDGRPTEA